MKEEKLIVRQRDKHCFFCEATSNLTAAHIFYWKKDKGKATKENLMCLCRECHDKMDFGKGIDKQQQLRMLRQCYAYLTFIYCEYGQQEEIPIKKLKL
jgi:5-methylcytosine-specific restriction endonuclease McrA